MAKKKEIELWTRDRKDTPLLGLFGIECPGMDWDDYEIWVNVKLGATPGQTRQIMKRQAKDQIAELQRDLEDDDLDDDDFDEDDDLEDDN